MSKPWIETPQTPTGGLSRQIDAWCCAATQTPIRLIQRSSAAAWFEKLAVTSLENLQQLPEASDRLLRPMLLLADAGLGSDYQKRWQEFQNKLTIFNAVKHVEKTLGLKSVDGVPLCRLLHRAQNLDDFTRGWGFEGIGYYHTNSVLRSRQPSDLMRDVPCDRLAPPALTMLHAGMGMAIADDLLKPLSATGDGELARALDDFERICLDNAVDGFAGASLEALGLMVRTYHRQLLQPTAEELRRRNNELTRYFWHGVGRSAYFAYEYFPPCCDLIIDQAAADAANQMERDNFVAGLAWAVTLVNLRHPELIDFVFHRHRVQRQYIAPLANGVVSSLLVAYDTAPEVEFMTSFCDYHWEDSEWFYRREILHGPCSLAATLNRQGIRDRIRMGDIFQFREPGWFFERVSK